MKLVVVKNQKDLENIKNINEEKILLVFLKDIKIKGEFKPIDKENSDIIILGNGCYIYDLFINRESENYNGLFSKVRNLNVRDLHIINANILSNEVCGTLAGNVKNNFKATNIYVSANIDADSIIGGLVGSANNSDVKSCNVCGFFCARGIIGGLVGISNTFVGSNNEIDDFNFTTLSNNPKCMIHNDVGFLSTREEDDLIMKLKPLMYRKKTTFYDRFKEL